MLMWYDCAHYNGMSVC